MGIGEGSTVTVTDKPANIGTGAHHNAACVTPREGTAASRTLTSKSADLVETTHSTGCVGIREGSTVTDTNKPANIGTGAHHIAGCVGIGEGRAVADTDKPADEDASARDIASCVGIGEPRRGTVTH